MLCVLLHWCALSESAHSSDVASPVGVHSSGCVFSYPEENVESLDFRIWGSLSSLPESASSVNALIEGVTLNEPGCLS